MKPIYVNKFCQSLGFSLYQGSTVSGRTVTKIIIVVEELVQRVTIQAGVAGGEVLWGELHSTETKRIVWMQSKKTVWGAGRKQKV